jgi:hypothetical protein
VERGDIGCVEHRHVALGAYLARRRALRQIKTAVEADLAERGLPIPPRPMSPRKIFFLGLLCALLVGLFVGLVFLGINLT